MQFYPDIAPVVPMAQPMYSEPMYMPPQQIYQPPPVMFQQQPFYTSTEILQPPVCTAIPREVTTIVEHPHPPVAAVVQMPSRHSVMPWREPAMTNLGEIILVAEFPNAMRQAKHALVPWLQQLNQERASHGLHQIGMRELNIKQRQQTLCFATLDSEKFTRNLVIFVMPGTGIRHLDHPGDGIDYKYLYRQANNGFNQVIACIVGPIVDQKLTRAGFAAGEPDPEHQEICDPILLDSGLFQGDAVALRLIKTGLFFSFYQHLNKMQFNQLTKIVKRLSSKCHRTDELSKVKFHH